MLSRVSTSLSTIAMAVVLGALASRAGATDRFYPDQKVLSANGRYRIEAKSPDNAGEHPRPFADHFVYSLYDTLTGDLIWQRAQPDNEASPVSVYLHNDAWVIIQTGWDELVVLHPVTARTVIRVRILDIFTEEEREAHVVDTTAGPIWEWNSMWYFAERGDELFFVVRPQWEKRIILDLPRARLLERNDPGVLELCRRVEAERALPILNANAADLEGLRQDEDWGRINGLETAALVAGQNGIKDALPALTALQHFDLTVSQGGAPSFRMAPSGSEIDPFECESSTLREIVQCSLRRLGERPLELPCTFFRLQGADYDDPFVGYRSSAEPRADRVEGIRPGHKAFEVLNTIGPPDHVDEWPDRCWVYDIDAVEPYTLRIYFSETNAVAKLVQGPPAWQTEEWIARLGW